MPRPRSDLSEMRPPRSWILRRTTSMPTPRPEISETVSAVEKPGRKMRLLISSSVRTASAADQTLFARLLQHALGIDAGAVVADLDDDAAAAMLGGKPDRALLGLARGQPIGRRFDAVIDRIADDMGQRIAEPLDDRPIDLGGFADHFQPDLLGCLGRQFANQPRHALEHRAHRLRAHRHDAVLQLARMMDDIFENLRQPAAHVFRQTLDDLSSIAWAMTSSPTMLTTRSIFSSSTRVVVARPRALPRPNAVPPRRRCRRRWRRRAIWPPAAGGRNNVLNRRTRPDNARRAADRRRRPVVRRDLELAIVDDELEDFVDLLRAWPRCSVPVQPCTDDRIKFRQRWQPVQSAPDQARRACAVRGEYRAAR